MIVKDNEVETVSLHSALNQASKTKLKKCRIFYIFICMLKCI